MFYKEKSGLNDVKLLIDISSLQLFYLLLKSHDYNVIINAQSTVCRKGKTHMCPCFH